MVKETKYGVFSDVHLDPRIVSVAIDVLKSKGVEKLLVNGDIGNQQETLKDSQSYVACIMDAIGKSGLEAFVQPGSHETMLAYEPVLEHFTGKFPNIIDTTKNQSVEQNGHQLVFLPGSDFLCDGEYQIGDGRVLGKETSTGSYMTSKGVPVLFPIDDWRVYVEAVKEGIKASPLHYFNMGDLRQLVKSPENTIVVCHVPRRFDNLETAVDMAVFGKVTKDFELQGEDIPKGSVFPFQVVQQIVQEGYPVKIKRENRGNHKLRSLYEELGITKAVSGHFHESGHRAHDSQGNHVEQGKKVNDLFWNSGLLDIGQTGILTVTGEEVSYENVCLQ